MQSTTHTTPLPPCIHLRAVDPARNIARDYRIEASPDLFGHWIIVLHWGRIGTKGQSKTISFVEQDHARRFIRSTLGKRQSAKKRIGVAYSMLHCVN